MAEYAARIDVAPREDDAYFRPGKDPFVVQHGGQRHGRGRLDEDFHPFPHPLHRLDDLVFFYQQDVFQVAGQGVERLVAQARAQSVRNGAFTVPGDGNVDFDPVFKVLSDAGYQGWLLVEAEQDPAKANPLEYAIKGRTYIREHTGL